MPPTSRSTLIIVVVLLISWFGYFPPPVGFETRDVFSISLLYGAPEILSFFLVILSVPLLLVRPKVGLVSSSLTGLIFLIGTPLDQLGLATPGRGPPPLVTADEILGAILSVLILIISYRAFSQPRFNEGKIKHAGSSLA